MKFKQLAAVRKAGVIPYFRSKEGLVMLFMKPSNPKFGGDKFQIAKGNIDPGEDVQTAAIREGSEELGLVPSNIVKIEKMAEQRLTGTDSSYIITVYAAEVKDQSAFTKPHYETAATRWMSMDEFRAEGRLSHLSIVQRLAN
jgi:8-oxo-dGTP pyrophosphatase MutT (NUDIX family)